MEGKKKKTKVVADQLSRKEGQVRSVRSNQGGGGWCGGALWRYQSSIWVGGTSAHWTHKYSTGWMEEEEGGAPPWTSLECISLTEEGDVKLGDVTTHRQTGERNKRKGGKHTRTCNWREKTNKQPKKNNGKHVDTSAETVCSNRKHVVVANGKNCVASTPCMSE